MVSDWLLDQGREMKANLTISQKILWGLLPRTYLGLFNSSEEAHDAYIKAAIFYYGKYARSS